MLSRQRPTRLHVEYSIEKTLLLLKWYKIDKIFSLAEHDCNIVAKEPIVFSLPVPYSYIKS